MHARGSEWTEDRIEKLKALHARKLSCSMMAAELGGVSRNAVIGKLHRLGLSNAFSTVHRDNQYGRKPRPAKNENRKTIHIVRANGNSNQHRVMESAETALVALRCVEVAPRHIALLDLQPHHCRYPYGEGQFTFCGHDKIDGKSYCGPHDAISTRTQRPISAAVQEQRRRTLRANYKLALVEVA